MNTKEASIVSIRLSAVAIIMFAIAVYAVVMLDRVTALTFLAMGWAVLAMAIMALVMEDAE